MLYNTDLTVTSHELLFLFLYEFLTIRETLAHAFTNLIVAEVAAVEHDRTELLHINTTVFSYDTLIDMSLHDLTHDTVTAEVITDAHTLHSIVSKLSSNMGASTLSAWLTVRPARFTLSGTFFVDAIPT